MNIIVKRYTAVWCQPCKMLTPLMDGIKSSYANNPDVKFITVDVDENPADAEQNGIRSVPTVIIYTNGVESDRFMGVQSRSVYVNSIEKGLMLQ